MRPAFAAALALGLFVTGIAGTGLAQDEPEARWYVGDAAAYTLDAPGASGTVTFTVGVPRWILNETGGFAWAVPLTIAWEDRGITRTLWSTDRVVYETTQGAQGGAWLDGRWGEAGLCPFALDCDDEPWPEKIAVDLGPWFGSAGPGESVHHLTRSSLVRGESPWLPREAPFRLPPLAVVAQEPWGPAGAPDAADAFAAFSADPEAAAVLEQGYVAVTWKHPTRDLSGGPAAIWQFVATDGDAVVERFVEPAPVAVLGPSWTVVGRGETRALPGHVPDRFPPSAPTMAVHLGGVADRAAMMQPTLHPPMQASSWGSWVACEQPSCRTIEHIVQVAQGTTDDGVILRVDGSGTMVSWHERSPDALVPLAAAPAEAVSVPGPGWQWPGVKATAFTGALALFVAFVAYAAPKLPFLGGFTRLRKKTILDQPARDRLMQLIDDSPGIHLKELARRSGLGDSTVRYHVGRLKEHGLVRLLSDGHRLGAWPIGTEASPVATWTAARRAVWEAIHAGVRSIPELVEATGRSRPTVSHHVAAIESAGLVRRRRDGRRVLIEVVT